MTAKPANRRPYRALQHRDFRNLWMAQLVSLIGSQMQVAAIHWHVYVLTGSALALGMIGLMRVGPIVVFSLWGGVLADRMDRRRLMFASQSVMALLAAFLSFSTFQGRDSLSLVYLVTAASAAAFAFDGPARQALVPRLVPTSDLPGALSLNVTVFHTAMIAGPALAGILIAGGAGAWPGTSIHVAAPATHKGLALCYLLNALSFVAVMIALSRMRTSGAIEVGKEEREKPLRALKEGFRFVFTTPIMVWTMTLDFFATFFAGAMTLLPIFADRVLHVGPAGYGGLVSAPAAGALLGSLFTSFRQLPKKTGHVLLWSIGFYGLFTVIFGLSRNYVLTFCALALSGMADVVSTVIRQTVRQLLTPDSLRGRMTSVNMIFFMGGPQLGELEAGLIASLFASVATGAMVSVVSGGLLTLMVTLFVAVRASVIRGYESGV